LKSNWTAERRVDPGDRVYPADWEKEKKNREAKSENVTL